jgi:hypothetical protein
MHLERLSQICAGRQPGDGNPHGGWAEKPDAGVLIEAGAVYAPMLLMPGNPSQLVE